MHSDQVDCISSSAPGDGVGYANSAVRYGQLEAQRPGHRGCARSVARSRPDVNCCPMPGRRLASTSVLINELSMA